MEPYCLDRAALENCLGDYLKQFPGLIRGCLADAGVSGSEVDLVIVTGGHGQWYFVREMLLGNMPQFGTIDFPKLREEPARIVTISRPQETVALGLAYSPIHMDWAVDAADVPSGPKQVRKDFEKTSVSLNGQKESTNAAQQELQERIRQMQIKQEEERQRQLQLQKEREERARMEQARRQQEAAEQRRKAQQDASHNYEALKRVPYTPETEFELASSNGCYWIKKYVGTSSVVSSPPMIRGRKVVAIGACAFGGPTIVQGNKSLEAVVIPDTVRSIGMRAFTGCFRLHTLIAHSAIEEIGESAFWGCDKLTKLDFGTGEMPAGHVRFPRSLKKIGPRAFTKAVSLTGETYLKEVLLSKRTVVKNGIGEKTFNENCCAVFYYD